MPGHMRDSQRQKVYNAEGTAVGHLGRALPTVPEMQAYVDKLLGEAWARRRWGARRVTVKDGRGHRNATGGYGDVQMPLWSRNERYLLHEVAHNVAGGAHWHDESFTRVCLELYAHVFGADAGKAYREACRKYHVRIGPPLVLRTPESTPAKRPVIVQRTYRVEIKHRGKPAELRTVKATAIDRVLVSLWSPTARPGPTVTGVRVWLGREPKTAAKPLRQAASRRPARD